MESGESREPRRAALDNSELASGRDFFDLGRSAVKKPKRSLCSKQTQTNTMKGGRGGSKKKATSRSAKAGLQFPVAACTAT